MFWCRAIIPELVNQPQDHMKPSLFVVPAITFFFASPQASLYLCKDFGIIHHRHPEFP